MTEWTLLQGIIGSRAHGTHHADSDTDRIRVFAAPTTEVAGLNWDRRRESLHETGPEGDFFHYEIGRFLNLCLKGSPSVLEALFLSQYEQQDEYGKKLVEIRGKLLSEEVIRNAYYHFTKNKLETLEKVRVNKIYKTSWHVIRFARQGRQLLQTGSTSLSMDPGEHKELTAMPLMQLFALASREVESILTVRSVLPEKPDVEAVSGFLDEVRIESVMDIPGWSKFLYED